MPAGLPVGGQTPMLSRFFSRRELTLSITVVVEPDGPGFHAYAPGLRGVHAAGDTAHDALDHAVAAIRLYVASVAQHGDPLAIGPDCVVGGPAPERFEVPVGAFLRHVTLQWPSLHTSGIS